MGQSDQTAPHIRPVERALWRRLQRAAEGGIRLVTLAPEVPGHQFKLRDYWSLANCHYMPGEYVYRFDTSIRAICRPRLIPLLCRTRAPEEH